MIRRPWLLLSAAATVTVPGLLAILAILGHEHAETRMAMRNAIALDPGLSVTVDGPATMSQHALGLRMLALAAQASQATSYQGTELTSEAAAGGNAITISRVWHHGGGLTRTETSTAVADVMRSPAGVFGVTGALVALLGKHYFAVYRGTGYAVGRPAAMVAVYRFDGSIAARFWLDRRTMVPLRREIFDASDQPVGEEAFVGVRFGALTGQPAAANAAEAAAAEPIWVTAASPGTLLASLAGQGWQLPEALPGGLPLYAAASTGTGAGEVIDLEYSDGLSIVSLFVQRGTLAPDMAGWRSATLGGHQVYVSGRSAAWTWGGVVCTMIADAPPRTVAQAVSGLPRKAPAGLLDRLRRGFDRLARLADPFR